LRTLPFLSKLRFAAFSRKYGYPPDLEGAAIRVIVQQA